MERRDEDTSEDYCFICKDGGELIICDFGGCPKAYHATCVGKDPEFLESDDHWTCGWHSCFLCGMRSLFQCFCCPRSICSTCNEVTKFVQLRATKGFCIECLKLLVMIVDEMDVDSDGARVDFKDTETFEYLFKDYWPLVKKSESLSDDDVRKAYSLFLNSENTNHQLDLDENSDCVVPIDLDDSEEEGDKTIRRSLMKTKGVSKSSKVKKIIRKYKSKKRQFIGWGSKELISFLQSIGRGTQIPLTQKQVFDVVMEYIRENKLLHPRKKRQVLCDNRLHELFGRKSISRLKINGWLDSHFAANEIPDEELNFSSESDNYEKTQGMNFEQKSRKSMFISDAEGVKLSTYACISVRNIRAVYLKRSLIEELLRCPNTFASKLTGCFVRIRSDSSADLRVSHKLVQITGTKEVVEGHIKDDSLTSIILLRWNQDKDLDIHKVSDDDFSEEECQQLGELVKQGLIKRPTVDELQKKALELHEVITKHWIKREMILLQNLIKRANEKGWRRELMEYTEKLDILRRPTEQKRLLLEIPTIVADAEIEHSHPVGNGEEPVQTLEGAEAGETGKTQMLTIVQDCLNGSEDEIGAANVVVAVESPEENKEMKIATEKETSSEKSRVQITCSSGVHRQDDDGKIKGSGMDNSCKNSANSRAYKADADIVIGSPEEKDKLSSKTIGFIAAEEIQQQKEYPIGGHETPSTEHCPENEGAFESAER